MPRALYDESGNEVASLPEDQNFDEILKKSQEFDQLAKQKTDLELQNKELEEAANPNWAVARRKISNLENLAKEKGFQVDDQGNVIDPKQINPDEIKRLAEETVRTNMFENFVEDELEGFGDEEREAARHYFEKLMTGEERSVKKAREVFREVEGFVRPHQKTPRVTVSGKPPRLQQSNYAESEEGKNLSKRLFGN